MKIGDLHQTIFDVLEVLSRLNIDYQIGGAVASSTFGMVRTTNNLDLVADINPEQIEKLNAALDNTFSVEERITDCVNQGFDLLHLETLLRVNIFHVSTQTFDRSAFARKIAVHLRDEPLLEAKFFTPEDVILYKLKQCQPGGLVPEKHWRDIVGILQIQTDLDTQYLRHWAAELGLGKLLEQAFKQAEM